MFHAWFLFGNNPLQVSRLFRIYIWPVEFSGRSERHIKTGFSLHSLCGCSVTHSTPSPPHLSRKILFQSFLLCNLRKNQWPFFTYFRDQNWKPAEIVRWEITLTIFLPWEMQNKKFKIGRGGCKYCGWPNSYKENKCTRNDVFSWQ